MKTLRESAISVRIPNVLKDRIKEAVKKYGYVNECDLIREAVRGHLFALERGQVRDKKETA